MNPVRVGLIGLGRWALDVHLPNLLRLPGCRVTAICSRSEVNRDRAKSALNEAPRECVRYEDLLDGDDADAVIVCTPNPLHEAISLKALQAGKHVLCEKPVALSLAGCARLQEAKRDSGKIFQTGFELRYSDVAREVKRLIDAGAVGSPSMIWCNILRDWGQFSGWRASMELSGGIYQELACHYLDLFNWFAGSIPRKISAEGASLTRQEVVDHLWTILRYSGEIIANLGICIFAPAKDDIILEIIGPDGRITADIIAGCIRFWKRGGAGQEDFSPARPKDYRYFGFPGSQESLAAFIQSIQTGIEPLADLSVGCEAVMTGLAATEALSSGHPVSLDEFKG